MALPTSVQACFESDRGQAVWRAANHPQPLCFPGTPTPTQELWAWKQLCSMQGYHGQFQSLKEWDKVTSKPLLGYPYDIEIQWTPKVHG